MKEMMAEMRVLKDSIHCWLSSLVRERGIMRDSCSREGK